MSQIKPTVIEAVARAIDGRLSLTYADGAPVIVIEHKSIDAAARAAITAHLAALAEQGMVVVPLEVSDKMISAAQPFKTIKGRWQAMIEASENN